MNIPELTHLDLIAKPSKERNRRNIVYGYDYPEILLPDEIPVYPDVLKQDFVYSEEFVLEVIKHLPDMVAQDLEVIEHKLGFRPKIQLKPEGLFENRLNMLPFGVRYSQIDYSPRPHYRETEISYGSSSVWIGEKPDWFCYLEDGHPMPVDKARIYSISDKRIELRVWRTHNITSYGLPFGFISRNFAIEFNNLGLRRL